MKGQGGKEWWGVAERCWGIVSRFVFLLGISTLQNFLKTPNACIIVIPPWCKIINDSE